MPTRTRTHCTHHESLPQPDKRPLRILSPLIAVAACYPCAHQFEHGTRLIVTDDDNPQRQYLLIPSPLVTFDHGTPGDPVLRPTA